MKPKQHLGIAIGGLMLLSGCFIGNVTDWADETFYQSQMHKEDDRAVKKYLRGIRLYDQFETVGIFDVLWNADELCTIYSRIHAAKMGKDREAELAFLRRQLSSNTYFVTMYVLSMNENPLTTSASSWVLYLDIDGKHYLPADIKIVELAPEYTQFFGSCISNHKQSYEIKFNRKDPDGNDILEGKKIVKLFFSNTRYFASVGWQLDEQGNVVNTFIPDKPPVAPAPSKPKIQKSLGKRSRTSKSDRDPKKQRSLGKRLSKEKDVQSPVVPTPFSTIPEESAPFSVTEKSTDLEVRAEYLLKAEEALDKPDTNAPSPAFVEYESLEEPEPERI